ncbi:MAG: phosphate ABC transporter permease PstA [Candidatus Limnocylindrales bacterium]
MASRGAEIFAPTSRRRRVKSSLFTVVATVALLLALIPLIAIFTYIFVNGIHSLLSLDFFTKDPPADVSAVGGGVRNALVGTLMMTGLASIIAVPIGVGIAIFAVEVGGGLARSARFLIDVLAGLPSIVVGIFVYTTVVVTQGHFSGLAGALALSIVMLPVVTVSAEEILRLTPRPLAEGARALGLSRWRAVLSVFVPIGLSGIMTGVLLGISRAIGETAPLLFTALGNNFFTLDLNQPMQALPLLIYRDALNSAYEAAKERAFGAALLLILIVFGFNLVGRWLTARRRLSGSRQ